MIEGGGCDVPWACRTQVWPGNRHHSPWLFGSGTKPVPPARSSPSRLPGSLLPVRKTRRAESELKLRLKRIQASTCAEWPPCTFLQGLEETSNEALNARRCCVVRMVRGRLERLWSLLSSLPLPCEWLPSSSSLFTATEDREGSFGGEGPSPRARIHRNLSGFCSLKVRFRAEAQKGASAARGLSCQSRDRADGPPWPRIVHSVMSQPQSSPPKPLQVSADPPWLPITEGRRCYNLHLPTSPPSEAFPGVN